MSGALLARLGVVERAQDISRGLLGSAWASSVSGYEDECRSRQGRVFQEAGYGRAASDATHDCCGAAGCTRPAQLAQSTLEEDNHRAGPPSKMLGVVIADKKNPSSCRVCNSRGQSTCGSAGRNPSLRHQGTWLEPPCDITDRHMSPAIRAAHARDQKCHGGQAVASPKLARLRSQSSCDREILAPWRSEGREQEERNDRANLPIPCRRARHRNPWRRPF